MYNIAIIGAGQLGSRHLQTLLKLSLRIAIYVVDPSSNSHNNCKERVAEMKIEGDLPSINYAFSLNQVPNILDYVIIATNSNVRYMILEQLVRKKKIKALLLEKVLFQRIKEYEAALKLVEFYKIPCWVNCPRRVTDIYSKINSFFKDEPLLYFNVHGGNWGLGCNSIHFVDILGFLTGKLPKELKTHGLDKEIIASKRDGFVEFTGRLSGTFGSTQFDFISTVEEDTSLMITIRSENKTCLLDETKGKAILYCQKGESKIKTVDFSMEPISNLMTEVAFNILLSKKCKLSTFKQSKDYHLPLIEAFISHMSVSLNKKAEICLIT